MILESKMQFKNPQPGKVTRTIEEHFTGRRVILENGESLFITKEQLGFEASLEDIESMVSELKEEKDEALEE